MKKEILTFCPTCHVRRLVLREYKHPLSLVKITRDCDKCWTENSVDIYRDKWGREIDPKSGRIV